MTDGTPRSDQDQAGERQVPAWVTDGCEYERTETLLDLGDAFAEEGLSAEEVAERVFSYCGGYAESTSYVADAACLRCGLRAARFARGLVAPSRAEILRDADEACEQFQPDLEFAQSLLALLEDAQVEDDLSLTGALNIATYLCVQDALSFRMFLNEFAGQSDEELVSAYYQICLMCRTLVSDATFAE